MKRMPREMFEYILNSAAKKARGLTTGMSTEKNLLPIIGELSLQR